MKKFLAMILTIAMVFSLAMPAMAAEVTGGTSSSVTASYTPSNPDITITDIVLSGDAVTVDATNKIYTITIPVGATKAAATFTVSGTDLGYITKETQSTYQIGYGGFATNLLVSRYKAETGNVSWEKTNFNTSDGGALKYTTDGGSSWTETGWTLKVVQTYTITNATTDTNGVVTVPASAAAGETVQLNVQANEGFELDTLTVVDASNNPVDVATNHTFTMPASDVTVTATFKVETAKYTVTVNTPENGTATINDAKDSYTEGETVTLTVTPADGYKLGSLTISDGTDTLDYTAGENNTYTFAMPAANVTVTATFEQIKYAVNINTTITNGTVSTDKTTAAEGETVKLTVTPADKYEYVVGSLKVTDAEGNEVTVNDDNTFTMPASDVTVTAQFKALPITSASITWGSLAYTYSDETSAWSVATAESGKQANDTVLVTNTGDVTFTATVSYSAADAFADLGVSGTITAAGGSNPATINAANSETFTLTLSGKPTQALSGDKIGTVTVTIDASAGN